MKEILLSDDARKALYLGVSKLSAAVKATLGPTGRNVVIKKENRPPFITKDGVTVAKEVELEDYFENLGAELVKEVASNTADMAGDGTTTATVLAEAILQIGSRHIANGVNATELRRGIDAAVKVVEEELGKMARPIKTKADIENVAFISSNGDKEIGQLLADLIDEIGSEGVATIETSKTSETYVDKIDGLHWRGGYVNHYFANKDNGEAVYDNPKILIFDGQIGAARDLILGNGNGFLEKALNPAGDGRPLVIVADSIEGEALRALVLNKIQQGFQILAVKTPFGGDKADYLEDLAIMTGGKVYSRAAGHKLNKIDVDELGGCGRIVATKDKTLILGGKGDQERIKERATTLRKYTDEEASLTEAQRKSIRERAAKLLSGVAVIHVGGDSEVELKERRDRVEDALFATQAAVEDGVVPGGGVALVRTITAVRKLKLENRNQQLGVDIIVEALSSPLQQIAENAGTNGELVLAKVLENKSVSYGYDAKNGEYIDLLKAGIIDPAKVTKCAIKNAASVAGLALTTEVLLVEKPKVQPTG